MSVYFYWERMGVEALA
uniref:Uncharacterized protein n=1 Tax=Anguilla anguilla TaxID=7936 RepID=A0A0E9T6J3_ANGAN